MNTRYNIKTSMGVETVYTCFLHWDLGQVVSLHIGTCRDFQVLGVGHQYILVTLGLWGKYIGTYIYRNIDTTIKNKKIWRSLKSSASLARGVIQHAP